LQVFVQRLGWRMNHEPNIYGTDGDASKGAAVYTPLALALYDLAVLRISNYLEERKAEIKGSK
jgi:hypothetical protein